MQLQPEPLQAVDEKGIVLGLVPDLCQHRLEQFAEPFRPRHKQVGRTEPRHEAAAEHLPGPRPGEADEIILPGLVLRRPVGELLPLPEPPGGRRAQSPPSVPRRFSPGGPGGDE